MIADFPPLCKIKAQKKCRISPAKQMPLASKEKTGFIFSFFLHPMIFCRFWLPRNFFPTHREFFKKYLEFPSLVVYTIIVHCSTTVCRKRQPLFHAAHADAKTTFRAAQRRVDRTQICRCCESPEYCGCQRRRGFFAALFFAFAKLREPHKPKREVI